MWIDVYCRLIYQTPRVCQVERHLAYLAKRYLPLSWAFWGKIFRCDLRLLQFHQDRNLV